MQTFRQYKFVYEHRKLEAKTRMESQRASEYHVRDVGRLILQVQNELKSLRREVASSGKPLSAKDADKILARAETDLRAKADVVLNSLIYSEAERLPPIHRGASPDTFRYSEAHPHGH